MKWTIAMGLVLALGAGCNEPSPGTDDDGAFVAENDDIVLGQQRNFLIEITLAAGTYVLEVRGFDESVTGAYQLDASATPSDNTPAQPTDQGGGGGGSGAWTLALLPLIFGVRRRRR